MRRLSPEGDDRESTPRDRATTGFAAAARPTARTALAQPIARASAP